MAKPHVPREEFEPVARLPLEKPIHYAGDEITELLFREPTGKLLSTIELAQRNTKTSQSMAVLAYFTGISTIALEHMTFSDTVKAVDIAGQLMVAAGLVSGDEEGGLGKS